MTAVLLLVVGLQAPSLSEQHRAFLEDVAHFLLTPEQRERFVTLETEASRTSFIESFWIGRDASEHEDRLRACDRLFGVRGRWSERGRVYQWLGAPTYREDLSRAGDRLVPTELWHYIGIDDSYLPDSFYLVFFKPGGSGDFRLWNPDADGVGSLVAASEPNRFDLGGETALRQIDVELAMAVEALVPGGGRREAQSLLANLQALPELAERERVFGENVRVAVSTRELPSRLVSSVWLDDVGVPELHYGLALSPGAISNLAWREDGGRFRMRFTLVGRLIGDGAERERWEDSLELDVSETERRSLATSQLVFRGRRLVQASDERLELALVTEGAGVVVGASVAPLPPSVDSTETASLASVFNEALNDVASPTRVLERARTDPEESRYRFARGLALARRGAIARALVELDASLALSPDDIRVHLERARLLYASRRYRDVLDRLGAVEERFDDEADAFVLMAAAAEALGLLEESVMHYEKALTLAPESVAIREALETARQRAR